MILTSVQLSYFLVYELERITLPFKVVGRIANELWGGAFNKSKKKDIKDLKEEERLMLEVDSMKADLGKTVKKTSAY